ncbi:transposase [Candidatus Avelusimicrobium faecicola]|uniref:transposase n=1 Tax=Candidatus Avelusimicrobium faecicola TaxID=3416205 RepID=UPI003D128271
MRMVKDIKNDISIINFFKQFPTELSVEQHFIKLRWGHHIICPFCGSNHIAEKKNRKPMPYRCKDCRQHFSIRTGTVLTESKISLQKWLLAIYLMTISHKSIRPARLAEQLGVTQKTVRLLCYRIRETLRKTPTVKAELKRGQVQTFVVSETKTNRLTKVIKDSANKNAENIH